MAQKIFVLTGPTASGKKEVSILLARHVNAEIISMDSMKVFIGMDIGTAKPAIESQGGIPHHLIDAVRPDEDFNVGRYVELAEMKIKEILKRGREVLFVGGTPLYLKAITEGVFEGPPADWQYREKLRKMEEEKGPGYLYEKLKTVDPQTAARLHPNDIKRILRALEIFEKTGKPISALQKQFGTKRGDYEFLILGLRRDREELYRRIEKRIDIMFEKGLVEEVRRLMSHYTLGRQALEAVGYREVIAHLRGEFNLQETIALVKKNTRHLAKRQLTWFRSMDDIIWIDKREGETPEEILSKILKRLKDL